MGWMVWKVVGEERAKAVKLPGGRRRRCKIQEHQPAVAASRRYKCRGALWIKPSKLPKTTVVVLSDIVFVLPQFKTHATLQPYKKGGQRIAPQKHRPSEPEALP